LVFPQIDKETLEIDGNHGNTLRKKEDVEKAVLDQRLLSEKVFAINATPSFIINGTLHSGGMSFEEFKAIIDPLVAKATGAK